MKELLFIGTVLVMCSPLSGGQFINKAEASTPPISAWNTFLGANSSVQQLVVDSSGNIYVAGSSQNSWGTPERSYTADSDEFVAKIDSSGNLIWNTFLGGTGTDSASSIDVDEAGNIFVSGFANASWGSPVRPYTGGGDTFIAKLDNDGHLIWNTFVGGSGGDYGQRIKVDLAGNTYVAGQGNITWGSPKRAFSSGDSDGFIAKIDPYGSLLWNTFLGGGGADYLARIVVNGNGVYVVGSSDMVWGSPPDGSFTDGDQNGLVVKVDTDGNLIWNTFVGLGTQFSDLAIDSTNNLYVSGIGSLWGSPVRPYSGGLDVVVAKLNSVGDVVWNTYLGSSAFMDAGGTIALDKYGNWHGRLTPLAR